MSDRSGGVPQVDPSAPVGVFGRVKRRLLRWSRRLGSAARWIGGASGLYLTIVSAVYPAASATPIALNLVLLAAVAGLMAAPGLYALSHLLRIAWGRRAQVSASPQGLVVTRDGRTQTTTCADIALGVVMPQAAGADLCLTLADGNELVVSVDSVASAEALLAALALDPDQRRIELAWNPLRRRLAAGAVAFMASLVLFTWLITVLGESTFVVPITFLTMVVPFLAAGAAARGVARSVSVGRDGVRGRDAFTRAQVDFEDTHAVRVDQDQLVFERGHGEPVRVSLAGLAPALRDLLTERIDEARARYTERVGSRAELFARGAREIEAWKRELSALLSRDAGFRGAALGREDALRVVEDPNAELDARVGAALALMGAASDKERVRVRVAAHTSVHPRVRVALEAALEGEVEEELVMVERAEREDSKEQAL